MVLLEVAVGVSATFTATAFAGKYLHKKTGGNLPSFKGILDPPLKDVKFITIPESQRKLINQEGIYVNKIPIPVYFGQTVPNLQKVAAAWDRILWDPEVLGQEAFEIIVKRNPPYRLRWVISQYPDLEEKIKSIIPDLDEKKTRDYRDLRKAEHRVRIDQYVNKPHPPIDPPPLQRLIETFAMDKEDLRGINDELAENMESLKKLEERFLALQKSVTSRFMELPEGEYDTLPESLKELYRLMFTPGPSRWVRFKTILSNKIKSVTDINGKILRKKKSWTDRLESEEAFKEHYRKKMQALIRFGTPLRRYTNRLMEKLDYMDDRIDAEWEVYKDWAFMLSTLDLRFWEQEIWNENTSYFHDFNAPRMFVPPGKHDFWYAENDMQEQIFEYMERHKEKRKGLGKHLMYYMDAAADVIDDNIEDDDVPDEFEEAELMPKINKLQDHALTNIANRFIIDIVDDVRVQYEATMRKELGLQSLPEQELEADSDDWTLYWQAEGGNDVVFDTTRTASLQLRMFARQNLNKIKKRRQAYLRRVQELQPYSEKETLDDPLGWQTKNKSEQDIDPFDTDPLQSPLYPELIKEYPNYEKELEDVEKQHSGISGPSLNDEEIAKAPSHPPAKFPDIWRPLPEGKKPRKLDDFDLFLYDLGEVDLMDETRLVEARRAAGDFSDTPPGFIDIFDDVWKDRDIERKKISEYEYYQTIKKMRDEGASEFDIDKYIESVEVDTPHPVWDSNVVIDRKYVGEIDEEVPGFTARDLTQSDYFRTMKHFDWRRLQEWDTFRMDKKLRDTIRKWEKRPGEEEVPSKYDLRRSKKRSMPDPDTWAARWEKVIDSVQDRLDKREEFRTENEFDDDYEDFEDFYDLKRGVDPIPDQNPVARDEKGRFDPAELAEEDDIDDDLEEYDIEKMIEEYKKEFPEDADKVEYKPINQWISPSAYEQSAASQSETGEEQQKKQQDQQDQQRGGEEGEAHGFTEDDDRWLGFILGNNDPEVSRNRMDDIEAVHHVAEWSRGRFRVPWEDEPDDPINEWGDNYLDPDRTRHKSPFRDPNDKTV